MGAAYVVFVGLVAVGLLAVLGSTDGEVATTDRAANVAGEGEDGLSAESALSVAASRALEAGADYDFQFSMTETTPATLTDLTGSGSYVGADSESTATANVSFEEEGFPFQWSTEGETRIVDGEIYQRGLGQSPLSGILSGHEWVHMDEAGWLITPGTPLVVAGQPPTYLEALVSTDEVTVAGTEEINGGTATMYQASLDPAIVYGAIAHLTNESYLDMIRRGVTMAATVWVDVAGWIQRVEVAVEFIDAPVPCDWVETVTGSTDPGQMTVLMNFEGFGGATPPVAPDPEAVGDASDASDAGELPVPSESAITNETEWCLVG